MIAEKPEFWFMFMKAFFKQDMSEIENDERFIGLFYKELEPTGNDVPENVDINFEENEQNTDTQQGRFTLTRKKFKRKP